MKFAKVILLTAALSSLALLNACGGAYDSQSSKSSGAHALSSLYGNRASEAATESASGAPQVDAFTVTSANADQYGSAAHAGQAFYFAQATGLAGLSLVFLTPGNFIEFSDGTAILTGTLVDKSQSDNQYNLQLNFTGRYNPTSSTDVQEELSPSAYVNDKGPVDPSTWHYYSSMSGTITGIDQLSSTVLNISKSHVYDFHVGIGASGKNVFEGAAAWFYCSVESDPNKALNLPSSSCQGDINVSLTQVPMTNPCPTPPVQPTPPTPTNPTPPTTPTPTTPTTPTYVPIIVVPVYYEPIVIPVSVTYGGCGCSDEYYGW